VFNKILKQAGSSSYTSDLHSVGAGFVSQLILDYSDSDFSWCSVFSLEKSRNCPEMHHGRFLPHQWPMRHLILVWSRTFYEYEPRLNKLYGFQWGVQSTKFSKNSCWSYENEYLDGQTRYPHFAFLCFQGMHKTKLFLYIT